MDIEKLIKEVNCFILDVRTSEEYKYGNVSGSVNIPLGTIIGRLEDMGIENSLGYLLCLRCQKRAGRGISITL